MTTSSHPEQSSPSPGRNPIRVAISIDFDAVAGWLGTGAHPDNSVADYSAGFFSARVGVPRLLRLLRKLGIADKTTWFLPGHSMETFPEETRRIVESGCEVGVHGYAHEGAFQLTETQERDVLLKCISLATELTGKRPIGWRAPLYQLRESTLSLLHSEGFVYDSSLSHYDSRPYFVSASAKPIEAPKFAPEVEARSWMRPLPSDVVGMEDQREGRSKGMLVEVPCNWYMEDMTPLQFWPHTPNSHGYVDVRVIERMWMDRFEFLRSDLLERRAEGEDVGMVVFPLTLHPDTSGMAHVIGMVERVLRWLKGFGDEVEFCTMGKIAREWQERQDGER